MKLLVSVIGEDEAIEAISGGGHIVDVKNPKEGSLGANFPRVIRGVKDTVSSKAKVSATIGDLPNLPGTASLAALGAVSSGAEYVKAGLFGVKTSVEATFLVKEVCRAVKEYDDACKIIPAGYADFKKVGCLNPLKLPQVAHNAKADGVMIDVKIKNSQNSLFDLLRYKELKKFVEDSHKFNLTVALAGSLQVKDIPKISNLEADIIGVRRAVCVGKDRLKGKVERTAVENFVKEISNTKWHLSGNVCKNRFLVF